MSKKEMTLTIEKQFCDICEKIEENSEFEKCCICNKTICPDCKIVIDPWTYTKLTLRESCAKYPEFI